MDRHGSGGFVNVINSLLYFIRVVIIEFFVDHLVEGVLENNVFNAVVPYQ